MTVPGRPAGSGLFGTRACELMVGGYVLYPARAAKIGVDAFAKDAVQAVEMPNTYMPNKK